MCRRRVAHEPIKLRLHRLLLLLQVIQRARDIEIKCVLAAEYMRKRACDNAAQPTNARARRHSHYVMMFLNVTVCVVHREFRGAA